MTEEEFKDMIIDERIALLVERKLSRDGKKIEEAEQLTSEMPLELRLRVETYLNLLMDEMAVSERAAYLGGVRDGMNLVKFVQRD